MGAGLRAGFSLLLRKLVWAAIGISGDMLSLSGFGKICYKLWVLRLGFRDRGSRVSAFGTGFHFKLPG